MKKFAFLCVMFSSFMIGIQAEESKAAATPAPAKVEEPAKAPQADPELDKLVQGKVEEAAKYAKEKGVDALIKEVNRKDGQFVFNNGLYIYVSFFDGSYQANAYFPALIGKNLMEIKGPDGYELGKEIIKTASTGNKWLEYKWKSPQTGKVADKRAYIIRAQGKGPDNKEYDLVIGSGYDKK